MKGWPDKQSESGVGPQSTSDSQEAHTPLAPAVATLLTLPQPTRRSLWQVPNSQLTEEENKPPGAWFADATAS